MEPVTAHILQLHAGLGKTVALVSLAAKRTPRTQLAVRAGIEPRGVRSGQFLGRRLSHWTKASAKTYVKMFEGPVTGNIPEVLDNGEVTEGTHVTAGQLALYAQVADLAVNTAASGNNAAAIQSLDDRVTAELASKLHSSALAPAIAPLASANNATLATVAANYGLKTVVDQHSLDIAARITPLEVDTKVANALASCPPQRWPPSSPAETISGLQASKADASALTAYALQSAVDTSSEVDSKITAALLDAVTTAALAGKAVDGLDTPLEVDTKVANAVLGLATEAFVAAQLASRDASISALQGAKADATLLASYATNAALSASKTTLQSALDAILAELAALQLSGSGGVVNAPAWAGFTTWELVRGSNVVRNLHLEAPLSAALANGDDTLSITADCYSVAAADAALAAALLAYYTSAQVDALLVDYRMGTAQDAETTSAISAALLAYTTLQADALLADYRTVSAQDTQTRARCCLPDGPGPGRLHRPTRSPRRCVPLGRQPGHGNGLEHRRRPAQLLHHCTGGQFAGRQARSHGGSIGAGDSRALSGRRRGRRGGGRHRRADPGPHGRLPGKLDGSPQQRQLFDSVEAKQYKRPDERGPEAGLRLGQLRRNEVEEPDGDRPVERRHREAWLDVVEAWQAQLRAEEQVNLEALRDLTDDFNVRDP